MLWFLLKVMAYGFEVVIIGLIVIICLGVMADRKPEWFERIFRQLILMEDDE